MSKDKCVMCGADTPYDFETHIDFRSNYIEGVGQLCYSCFNEGTDEKPLSVTRKFINDNPNDMVLGEKIRTIFNGK